MKFYKAMRDKDGFSMIEADLGGGGGRMKEWLENMEWCPHCGAKMDKEDPT